MTQQVSRDEIFPAMASSSFIFKSLIKLKTKDNKSFQFNLISSCLTLCKRNKQKSKLLLHLECTSLPFRNQLLITTEDQDFYSTNLIIHFVRKKLIENSVTIKYILTRSDWDGSKKIRISRIIILGNFLFQIKSGKYVMSIALHYIVICHIVALQSYQVTFLNILLCTKLTFFGHNLSKK